MGKTKKSDALNPSDIKDDLLTVGPKKIKVVDHSKPKEASVFANLQPTNVAKPATKSVNGLEEKVIVAEVPIVETPPAPIVPETIVYEITYMEGTVEQIVYARGLPTITEKYILRLYGAFGRSNLREVVLGRKEIKISCNVPLVNPDLQIDMRSGLLIKVVSEADWMTREYDDTKKLFDDAVLKAYREMAAAGITAVTPQPSGAVATGKKKVVPLPPPDNEEHFPVGNIPVNRGPIMGDF